MMTDRSKLEALVWRRIPATMKVATSGLKLVMDPTTRALSPMSALADATLFEVLRRVNIPTAALEVA